MTIWRGNHMRAAATQEETEARRVNDVVTRPLQSDSRILILVYKSLHRRDVSSSPSRNLFNWKAVFARFFGTLGIGRATIILATITETVTVSVFTVFWFASSWAFSLSLLFRCVFEVAWWWFMVKWSESRITRHSAAARHRWFTSYISCSVLFISRLYQPSVPSS
jgi:hypothetical protein